MASPPKSGTVLERILCDVDRLEPLPTSVNRVVQALDDPQGNAGAVAALLSLDQALTVEVLRQANSALMACGSPSASVQDAVMRLGFRRVRSLVLGAGAGRLLGRRLGGYRLAAEELRTHSVACASLAQSLAALLRYPNQEEAYVAGLLHDMGKLVLDQYLRVDYVAIADTMRRDRLPLWKVEERLYGMDHGGIGGLMAAKWSFPPELVDAIRCHHWPSHARTRPALAAIVNVADSLTPASPSGLMSPLERIVDPKALAILNLTEARLESIKFELCSQGPNGQPPESLEG